MFVSIPVADQDRALTFYTEVLGFRLLTDQLFNEKQRWLAFREPRRGLCCSGLATSFSLAVS